MNALTADVMPSRWRNLITILNMEISESVYADLGVPVPSWRKLHGISYKLIHEHMSAALDLRADTGHLAETYLRLLSEQFGTKTANRFLTWVLLVWNQLHGSTWDWFAYEFAFSGWAGAFGSGVNANLSFGERNDLVHRLYSDNCIEPYKNALLVERAYRVHGLSHSDSDILHMQGFASISNGSFIKEE